LCCRNSMTLVALKLMDLNIYNSMAMIYAEQNNMRDVLGEVG
jgi:hypothetical protein